jgi:hypothetical protein
MSSKDDRALTNELLAKILDVLESQKQVDVPSDFCFDRYLFVPANTTVTTDIKLPTPGCYISFISHTPYLPAFFIYNQNNALIARIGGSAWTMVTVEAGPFVDLNITAIGGSADRHVTIWVSTRPIRVSSI